MFIQYKNNDTTNLKCRKKKWLNYKLMIYTNSNIYIKYLKNDSEFCFGFNLYNNLNWISSKYFVNYIWNLLENESELEAIQVDEETGEIIVSKSDKKKKRAERRTAENEVNINVDNERQKDEADILKTKSLLK